MLFLQCVYVLEISSSRIAVHSISVPTFDVCDNVRNNCCWSRLDSCCARFACICLRYILRGARPSFCKLLVARRYLPHPREPVLQFRVCEYWRCLFRERRTKTSCFKSSALASITHQRQ